MKDVYVIDYGVGNILNVVRALTYCDAKVHIVDQPENWPSSGLVILPGVGAFGRGISQINESGLAEKIREHVDSGDPLLGICLGMQLLFEQSVEFGTNKGLGFVSGSVEKIEPVDTFGNRLKVPHIGWNELLHTSEHQDWKGTVLASLKESDAVYFVHSYAGILSNSENALSVCSYGGKKILAAVQVDNVHGCQFHPEKSGEVGHKIIRNFMSF